MNVSRGCDRNMWTKGELYSYPLYICQSKPAHTAQKVHLT